MLQTSMASGQYEIASESERNAGKRYAFDSAMTRNRQGAERRAAEGIAYFQELALRWDEQYLRKSMGEDA